MLPLGPDPAALFYFGYLLVGIRTSRPHAICLPLAASLRAIMPAVISLPMIVTMVVRAASNSSPAYWSGAPIVNATVIIAATVAGAFVGGLVYRLWCVVYAADFTALPS